jgi:hypothetical protein
MSHRTDSIRCSNIDAVLQKIKGLTVYCYSPCVVENVFSFFVEEGQPANIYSSNAE